MTSSCDSPPTRRRRRADRRLQRGVAPWRPTAETILFVLLFVLSATPLSECGRSAGRRRPSVTIAGSRHAAESRKVPACPSDACRCRWTRSPSVGPVASCLPSAERPTLPEIFRSSADDERVASGSDERTTMTYAELYVRRANLTEIPAGSFRRVGARLLDLTGNAFARPAAIAPDAFAGPLESSLATLVMAECGLTVVPSASIGQLAALRVLRLEGNAISALQAGDFSTASLREIYIFRNSIRRIGQRAFDGLDRLEKLSLADNEIEYLEPGMFASLANLTSLDVTRNRLTQLPDGWLDGLGALRWLELESNRVTSVGPSTFRGAPMLRYMRAENNPLTTIRDGSFRAIGHLNYLSIDLSNVTSLTSVTMTGLRRLRTLSLGELRHSAPLMPDGFFAPVRRLKYLSLTDYEGLLSDDDIAAAVRPSLFGAGFRFRHLNVWLAPIRGCRCSAAWIRRLGAQGAYVHGFCADNRPLSCPAGGKSAAAIAKLTYGKHENARRHRRKFKSGN